MSIFTGKAIVITGAAMGLGLATSKVVAQKGANLSIVDYNEEALEKQNKKFKRLLQKQKF